MPRWRLAALFLLITLPLCSVLAPLIPPAEAPDENTQALRAESLLHGDLVGRRTAIPMPDGPHLEALLDADPGLHRLMVMFRDLPSEARVVTAALRERMRAVRWAGVSNEYSAQTAPYPPIFYLPAALGLAIARLSRMQPLDALTLARLSNAAFYASGGTLALGLAGRGRLLMLATLALPMSLWLAAAIHPDAPMLSCVAIVVALTGRAMTGDRQRAGGPALWISAVLLGCVIAMKPPLVALAGLLLLPLRRADWTRRATAAGRLAAVGLALVLGLGWTAYAQHAAAIPFVRDGLYQAGPLFPGDPSTVFRTTDPAAQARTLLAHPTRLVTLPMRTLVAEAGSKLREMVGVLGQLDLPLPGWLFRLWVVALAAAALGDLFGRKQEHSRGLLEPLFVLGIGLACMIATYLALYLTWTPVGAARIEGVQGRYFLPELLLLGLVLPRLRSPAARPLRTACALIIAAAGLASAATLPILTVQAYYLH